MKKILLGLLMTAGVIALPTTGLAEEERAPAAEHPGQALETAPVRPKNREELRRIKEEKRARRHERFHENAKRKHEKLHERRDRREDRWDPRHEGGPKPHTDQGVRDWGRGQGREGVAQGGERRSPRSKGGVRGGPKR